MGRDKNTEVRPPRHLSEATQRFFRLMIKKYPHLRHTGFKEQLVAACDARDRYINAREQLKEAGSLTQIDRFGTLKARPEVAIENSNIALFSRLMVKLKLVPEKTARKRGTSARKR